jgi:uncharacterized protein (TIGR03437 family)
MRRFHVLALGVFLAAIGRAQAPAVVENGVLNSATYSKAGQPGFAVAPGSLVSIFGSALASGLAQADSVPLSTSLAGVTVTFNDTPAPLHFVSPMQINAQLPWNLLSPGAQSGTATVVVTNSGGSSLPRNVQLAPLSPGIYTLEATGLGAAFAINADDGSFAAPAGSVPGFSSRPARIGGVIIIYATGLGPVDPPVASGAASLDALRRTVVEPELRIGGQQAQVAFSGLSPQFPGVYQLNAVVPAGVQPGNTVPIQIIAGGITTSDQVSLAVGP